MNTSVTETAIHTSNLTRKFGDLTAVERLSVDILSGEVFGILGPNGAGKTTTVRMLTSLIAPTSGEATVNGFRVGESDMAIRQSVGILTETPGLYQNLTAYRNLEIYARLYEVENAGKQIEKYLRMFGLWSRRDDPAGSYSKGMRQKLALARALLHEPQTVFLDEPTAGLDPVAARLVRESILDMSEEGRTVVICTHNLDEADRLCDRIGVFKTRMLVLDTPANLRARLFGRKIVIHLSHIKDTYLDSIKRFPYVQGVTAIKNKLVITLEDPETQNPEIIHDLVKAGAPIQFVGEMRRSLEDVYMQLIKSENEKTGP